MKSQKKQIPYIDDPEFIEKLDNQAKKENRSRNNLIQVALREYLKNK